jgi:hypothetical protein
MYIVKRQFPDGDGSDGGPYNFWYNSAVGGPGSGFPIADAERQTAYAVKWSVLLALFVIFFLWITLGYYHARRRIKAGLKPLAYHKVGHRLQLYGCC